MKATETTCETDQILNLWEKEFMELIEFMIKEVKV